MYVGHYSERRCLENVGCRESKDRGRTRIGIDVEKDQGLRESREGERRERENRVVKESRVRENRREKENRTTSRVTSCRLPRVCSFSTVTPPGSSPRLVSSPPPCPREPPTYLLSANSFCFLRRVKGIQLVDWWSLLFVMHMYISALVH